MKTRIQALINPNQKHTERNQKVPGRPQRPGLPWNLMVSLCVSLRGSYGSLKAAFRNSTYFFYNLPGCIPNSSDN
jgi:hypothetical protein